MKYQTERQYQLDSGIVLKRYTNGSFAYFTTNGTWANVNRELADLLIMFYGRK